MTSFICKRKILSPPLIFLPPYRFFSVRVKCTQNAMSGTFNQCCSDLVKTSYAIDQQQNVMAELPVDNAAISIHLRLQMSFHGDRS